MYADDLAIIAESKQDLQEVLEEWKGVRMSIEKTEVMWVGHQREELNIKLDGMEIKPVDGFVHLGYGGWAFSSISATSDTSGSKCLEKGRGSHVGQKKLKNAEKESPENVCYTSMPVWSGECGVDRTIEAASV